MNLGKITNTLTFGVENYGIVTTISYVAERVKASFSHYSRKFFSEFSGDVHTYIVYLQYTGEHMEQGLKHLHFVLCLLGFHRSTIVIVDNSIGADFTEKLSDNIFLISGDNSCYDFTGYDVGIAWHKAHSALKDPDCIILCNDSFFRNYGHDYLKCFKKRQLTGSLKKNRLIGYTDSYPHKIIIFGMELKSWVRTNFFIMNVQTLNKLAPFTIDKTDSTLFSENCRDFFSASINISENYKKYLRTWLFGEQCSDDFKEKWHAHANIDGTNFINFKKKAKCILSEHYLSARVLQDRNEIFSVNTGKVLSGPE